MDIVERTRPKGFNRKVWQHCYAEAEANKAWALDIVINKPGWAKQASDISIEMLGEYLYKRAHQLAEDSYRYLEMRSHGETFIGALDPSARRKWIELTGKNIGPNKLWQYDHTTHTTSATKRKGKWTHWLNGKPITKRGA